MTPLDREMSIPLSIRDRVWGGAGLLDGLTAPQAAQEPQGGPVVLLTALRRLRATDAPRLAA